MAVIGWLYELSTDTEFNICFDKFWRSEYPGSNTDSDPGEQTCSLATPSCTEGVRDRQLRGYRVRGSHPRRCCCASGPGPGSASGGQPAVSAASHFVLPCAVGPRVLSVAREQIERGPGALPTSSV